ncbi:MAG: amidohydrolase family protein [Candidatus Limnocylindria bacterium]
MLAFRAERIVDGTGGDPFGPAVLLVEDGRIREVGSAKTVRVPRDVEVIDLAGRTLLPGLVDAHTHYGAHFPGGIIPPTTHEILLQAVEHLGRDLRSGVTTARTLGERDFLDISYRQGIERGWIQGPRTLVAGRGIQPTTTDMPVTDLHVEGPDEMRRAIRENVKRGADVIKLFLNPSFRSPTPLRPNFSREEIDVAVAEAHRAGKRVAAHVLGGAAMDDAIDAGVDTFEHAILVSDAQLERLARGKRWLVLTQSLKLWQPDGAAAPAMKDEMHLALEALPRKAREAGVRLTAGTDTAHGLLHFEAVCLARAGLSQLEAIQAVTARAAEALDVASEVGTLEAGKRADAIAVRADPLADVAALADVEFVMKGGKVVVNDG